MPIVHVGMIAHFAIMLPADSHHNYWHTVDLGRHRDGAWTLGEFPLPLTSSRPRPVPQAEPDTRSLSDRLHRPGRTLISRHGNGPTSSRRRAAVTCPEGMAAFSRGHFSRASVRAKLPGMPPSRESRRRSGRGTCPGCHGIHGAEQIASLLFQKPAGADWLARLSA